MSAQALFEFHEPTIHQRGTSCTMCKPTGPPNLFAVAREMYVLLRWVANGDHDGFCPAGPIDDGECECLRGRAEQLVARAEARNP